MKPRTLERTDPDGFQKALRRVMQRAREQAQKRIVLPDPPDYVDRSCGNVPLNVTPEEETKP